MIFLFLSIMNTNIRYLLLNRIFPFAHLKAHKMASALCYNLFVFSVFLWTWDLFPAIFISCKINFDWLIEISLTNGIHVYISCEILAKNKHAVRLEDCLASKSAIFDSNFDQQIRFMYTSIKVTVELTYFFSF